MKTKDIQMVRGQHLAITFTVKDNRGSPLDLTGALVYLWITADMKVDAAVKLSSAVTAGHRVGIVVAPDQAANKGQFTATAIPADTASLVALGADDPYLYDVWVVDSTGQRYPVIATSRLALYPQVTTVP
jgi:hypothetical protein